MAHERGGSALIGSVALAALVADASYAATDWRRIGTGFMVGLAILVAAALVAKALGVADARKARRNNLVLGLLIFVSVGAVLALGSRFAWGVLLGELAALGCLFAAVGLRAALRAA